jgi:glutamine synthetase
MTPAEVTKFIEKQGVKLIDFKFADLLGTWQHFTTTLNEYSEDIFTDGLGFDGSSIRGWRVINASDMLVIPDPATAWIDVFNAEPTLSFICTITDPITREPYDRDPRGVAERAETYLKSTGIADTAYFGPEAEFFIFDDVRYDYTSNTSFHSVDSVEGIWNSAREEFPNLGHKIRHKEGYFPVSPTDTLQDIRNEMCLEMEKAGIPIERQHHEVGTAGQAEIDIRFAPLKLMADHMMYYKYITKNVAKKYNKVVTFMPKPLFGDNGSGMHTHSSLW